MRKIFIYVLLIISCFGLCGCNKEYKLANNSIAEIRYNIFAGSNDNLSITFMSGQREKDYVINGYNTDLVDFGVITITINNPEIDTTNSSVALTIDTLRYEEVLEKNPFDGTLVADIGVVVNNNINNMSAKVFIGESVDEITLTNLSYDWEVDCNKALKLACNELSNELSPLMTNEFLGEVYIKIIEDTISNNGHLWYVNFISRDGIQHSVIIDPSSSEILAKK